MTDAPTPAPSPVPALRLGPTSWRLHRRAVLAGLGTAALLAVAIVLDIGSGEVSLSPTQVLSSLTGGGTRETDVIVYDLRLPQTTLALLVGAVLSLSGALLQTITRNALATPDVIGINAGASLGAVIYIVWRGDSEGGLGNGFAAVAGLPAAALVGALATSVLLAALSRRGGLDSRRLVLLGIGISATLTAGVNWLLISARLQTAVAAQLWLTGSLNNRGWVEAIPVLAFLAVALPLLLVLGRHLDALHLGPDSASSLGVRLTATQVLFLFVAVLGAAVSVAAVGPLGFVAFLCPQLAQRIAGTARPPLPNTMLTGATLVVLADLVSRSWLSTPLAAGIVTSMIGAPYFLYLLFRMNRGSTA